MSVPKKRKLAAMEQDTQISTSSPAEDEHLKVQRIQEQLNKCKDAFSDILTAAIELGTMHEQPGWYEAYDDLRSAEDDFEIAMLVAENILYAAPGYQH